jgi:predicted permease
LAGELWQDLRHAARRLRRNARSSVLIVATLALGVGAVLGVFSIAHAVFSRPLGVGQPEQLVLLADGSVNGHWLGGLPARNGQVQLYSYPLYQRLSQSGTGVELAAEDGNPASAVLFGRDPADAIPETPARGRCVSANYFDVLRVPAYGGRGFVPEDEQAEHARPVTVLSYSFWQARFGGDPQRIGTSIEINGTPYTVVGVAPPGFGGVDLGSPSDYWMPLRTPACSFLGQGIENPEFYWLHVLGRLKSGATPASVEAQATATVTQFVAESAGRADGPRFVRLQPGALGFSRLRENLREPLLALLGGACVWLLIVCLDVSYLFLARCVSRRHEIGICVALGATRTRLIRQLACEALLLSLLGAALGAAPARAFSSGALSWVSKGSSGIRTELVLSVDATVIALALVLALSAALVVVIAPAWHVSRMSLQAALGAAPNGGAGPAPLRFGRWLVMSQVASSLVLLVAAGLFGETLQRLRTVRTGYEAEHVLLAQLNFQSAGLSPEQLRSLYAELPRRLAALPGVSAASLAYPDVLTGAALNWGIARPSAPEVRSRAQLYLVTPGYFDALGLRVSLGRGFTLADDATAPRVAIVSETAVRAHFGGADPLGERFRLDELHDVEVVGVVSDARTLGLRDDPQATLYLPAAQPHGIPLEFELSSLQVRAAGDPALLAQRVRQLIWQAAPSLPLSNLRTLGDQLERNVLEERVLALLARSFGLGALLLVAIGLYGVISEWATQRTREIGLRIAFGATAGSVQRLVLWQALRWVAAGLALGTPASLAIAQLLRGFLFQTSPLDPGALSGAALAVLVVSTLAAYLPARRASRLEPVIALRWE